MANILVGTVLEWLDENDETLSIGRVLWISPDPLDKDIVIMNITDESHMGFPYWAKLNVIEEELEEGNVRKIDFLPDAKMMDETFIQKHAIRRDIKWSIIKEIALYEPDIYISKKRGRLVQQVCKEHNKHKKVIYEYLKVFWFHGKMINGLLPDYKKSGAPGQERNYLRKPGQRPEEAKQNSKLVGLVITENEKKVFRRFINHYFKQKNLDFKDVWHIMLDKHYISGYYRENGVKIPIPLPPEQRPTLRQFGYFFNKQYSFREKNTGRLGKRRYQKNHRHMDGDERQRAWGPGAVYQIDSTPSDVYIVHSLKREQVIGKPILYLVVDVFSSLISGFYGWLKAASYMGAAMAFEQSTMCKVDFCKEFDITISEEDWPSHGLPRYLTADGGELSGYNAEHMVALETKVEILPAYRPELKGIIEQLMRKMNVEAKRCFPGALIKPIKERGDKDYRLEAVASLRAYYKFVIQCISEHNNSIVSDEFVVDPKMYEDGIKLTPVEIWKWGVANRTSGLHEKPRDLIRMNLLPRDTATVTQAGFKYGKLRYTCKQGEDEGWFEAESIDQSKKIDISFDPRICGGIYVRRRNGEFIFCHLTRKYEKYKNLSFDEVKKILDMPIAQKKEFKEEQYLVKSKSRAVKEHIQAVESELTNPVIKGKNKNNRIKNMSETNQDERNNWAQEQSWIAEEISEAYQDHNDLVKEDYLDQVNQDKIDDFMNFTRKKWGESND